MLMTSDTPPATPTPFEDMDPRLERLREPDGLGDDPYFPDPYFPNPYSLL